MVYLVTSRNGWEVSEQFSLTSYSNLEKFLEEKNWFNLDTETSGLNYIDDHLLTIQVGDEVDQYVIDVREGIPQCVIDAIQDENVTKYLANAIFDYRFLLKYDIVMENVFDVLLADRILYNGKSRWSKNNPNGFRFRLKDVMNRHLSIDMDKEAQSSFIDMSDHELTEEQIIYAAKDVQHLQKIAAKQIYYLGKVDMLEVCQLEMDNILVNGDITFTGLKIDVNKWLANEKWAATLVDPPLKKLNHLFYNEEIFKDLAYYKENQLSLFEGVERSNKINWGSPQQVSKVFNAIPGVLNASSSADFYKTFWGKHPIIEAFRDYKEYSSFITKYGKSYLDKYTWSDGKIHPEIDPIKETGRESYNNPNLQQIPVSSLPEGHEGRYRECFIPPKGFVWVGADYTAQEAVIVATKSGEPLWIEAFRNGWDLHSMVAELVFGEEWHEATEQDCNFVINKQKCKCKGHKPLRQISKTVTYGLIYGMSPHKLALTLNIPIDQAEEIFQRYFEKLTRIKWFVDKTQAYGVKYGHIKTFSPYLRRRYFNDWKKDIKDKKLLSSIQRKSSNTPVQGSGADMTKKAAVLMRKWINENNLRDKIQLILKVHDEINMQVVEYMAAEAAKKLEYFMEEAAKIVLNNDLLKAEAEISNHWSK